MGGAAEEGSQVPEAIGRAWTDTVGRLQAKTSQYRWRAVKGPMSATIATLLEEGWDPVGPLLWQDTEGARWELNLQVPNLGLQIRHQVAHHAEQRQWKIAAKHFLGQGMEQGVDLRSFHQEVRQLRKGLAPMRQPCPPVPTPAALVAMAHRIIQGAVWPHTRRLAAGYQPPQIGDHLPTANVCRACGQVGQGHHFHEAWECPVVLDSIHPQLRADDDLLQAARQHYVRTPCL